MPPPTPLQLAEAAELYPSLWVLQHEIKNETGFPIEFEKRRFLWDVYNDLSPNQVLLKPPQIGATVMNTLKSMYVAHKLRRQIIYTLPTQGDVQDMVGGSINRIIAQNPILMSWVKDHDTVEQKQVGDSIIFYRGTFTAKQAMMIPSGLNIHDEVDASDPDVITQYETRLQAQEDGGWRWYFSHPSLAGHGVDIYWQQSDKKEWFITCSHCAEQQVLTWPDNISIERTCYICRFCKHELSNEERIYGVWKNQDGTEWTGSIAGDYKFSGWHISQLMLYNKTAQDIIDAFNDPLKTKQYFYNYVLGLPYQSSDDLIPSAVILRNCVEEVNSQENRVIIGVDTGLPWHVTILNKDGVFYYERFKEIGKPGTPPGYDPLNRMREFLQRWPKAIIVSDQGGDLSPMRILQEEFSGRVFLCYYRKDRKTSKIIQWGLDGSDYEKYGEVYVDRNNMIQLIVEQLREIGRIRLNGEKDEWTDFAAHFDNIYRERLVVKEQKDKDDRTLYGAEYVWKRKGPDHFVHALLYGLVGLSRFSETLAKVLSDDDVFKGLRSGPIVKDEGIIMGRPVDL